MKWIAENLYWLGPATVPLFLTGLWALAFKYPTKFPEVVGLPLIGLALLIYGGIWIWTTIVMWSVSGSLVECVADASCGKERVAPFANDLGFYLSLQVVAYFIALALLLYVMVLNILPRKLTGK